MATSEEVAYILNDCRPEVIFFSNGTEAVIKEAEEFLQYSPEYFNVDKITIPALKTEAAPVEEPAPDKTVLIIYTSGTTGDPKGVMLSYDNLKANFEVLTLSTTYYTEKNRTLTLLPLHHIFPLLGSLVLTLYAGGIVVFSPSLKSEDILDALQKNRVTMIIGVPRFYAALQKGIMDKINGKAVTRAVFKIASIFKSKKLSKIIFKKVHEKFGGAVTHMICGGAKLNERVGWDFKTLGFEIAEGYGMTETAPMISFPPEDGIKIGSPGKPVSTLQVEIRDGEIVVKGRNVMQGYYEKPEDTAAILKDGWLHTGDLGHISKDGYLHVTGRKKEIIVLSSGKNINPVLIENKIKSMSNLVAEIGVFHKNEQLQAVIYPDFKELKAQEISNIEESLRWEVLDRYNQKVSPYKKIMSFAISKEELPKTRLGKMKRHQLAFSAGEKSIKKPPVDEPQFPEYTTIKTYLREQTKNEIYPDDHFEIDLGLDSLDKVSFQTFLSSTFGIEMKDDILVNHPTVLKLSEFIKSKKLKFKVEAVKWGEIFKEKIDFTLPKSWVTQNIFKNVTKVFLKLYFRLKGEGMHNLPEGPVILAPNHQSFFDSLFLMAFLKNRFMKKTYFYAKEKHVRRRWLKFLAGRHNIIIMDINKDLKLSLRKMAEILKRERNIIIFPEGTRSKDGNLGKFKKTFAILSKELDIPVVPVAIQGAFNALPRGSVFPRPFKKINVNFLNPVYPEKHNYDTLIDIVHDKINDKVSAAD
jgi:long-chain acyl-CoA synthetase